MKVTPEIIQHEFMGLKARVGKSANQNYVGISGTVVNETRNTFIIKHERKNRTIIKDQAVFHFTLPDTTIVEINGKLLVGRPEGRLKKRIRRLW